MAENTSGPDTGPEKNKDNWMRSLGLFSVIVADLIGSSAVGVGLGYVLYTYAGFPRWFIAVTSLAGVSLGMYRVYQISKKLNS